MTIGSIKSPSNTFFHLNLSSTFSCFLNTSNIIKMIPVFVIPILPRCADDYLHFAISCFHKIHACASHNTCPASPRKDSSVVAFRDFAGTEEDVLCAVCLILFEEDDEIRKLCNCNHIFHRACLEKWADQYQNMFSSSTRRLKYYLVRETLSLIIKYLVCKRQFLMT